MVSVSFRSFDTPVLLDRLEPNSEDIDAAHAPDDDVADHPVLVGIPRMGSREGFRARALGAREGEEHDYQEERELDLPMHRHVDGRDDSEDEAQRHGPTRLMGNVRLDAHAAHKILPVHDAERRVGLVQELHLPAQRPDVRADAVGDKRRVVEHAQDEGGQLAAPLRVVGSDHLVPAMFRGHRLPVALERDVDLGH